MRLSLVIQLAGLDVYVLVPMWILLLLGSDALQYSGIIQ